VIVHARSSSSGVKSGVTCTVSAPIDRHTVRTAVVPTFLRTNLFVGVTDRGWYDHSHAMRPDDVNFWRPSGTNFRALSPGDPFRFKLHAPWNAIVVGGFFVEAIRMPVWQAWMAFELRNGVADLDEFMTRIDRYRQQRTDDRRDPDRPWKRSTIGTYLIGLSVNPDRPCCAHA
jgi:hypothetical protein